MHDLRYTLVADGTSDRALLPILTWLLRRLGVNLAIQPEWANLGRLRNPPKKLEDKIASAIDLYPCDILFVHRDAEKEPLKSRTKEIREAERLAAEKFVEDLKPIPPIVCVIPIRMTESWLLFDELAIRELVGNRNGKQELNLPKSSAIEKIPDSKAVLKEILGKATGRSKRRQQDNISISRLSENIDDFEPLRSLSAFQELEKELQNTLSSHQWI